LLLQCRWKRDGKTEQEQDRFRRERERGDRSGSTRSGSGNNFSRRDYDNQGDSLGNDIWDMDPASEPLAFTSGLDPIQEFLIRERMKNQRPQASSEASSPPHLQQPPQHKSGQQAPQQKRGASAADGATSSDSLPFHRAADPLLSEFTSGAEGMDDIAAMAFIGVNSTAFYVVRN